MSTGLPWLLNWAMGWAWGDPGWHNDGWGWNGGGWNGGGHVWNGNVNDTVNRTFNDINRGGGKTTLKETSNAVWSMEEGAISAVNWSEVAAVEDTEEVAAKPGSSCCITRLANPLPPTLEPF